MPLYTGGGSTVTSANIVDGEIINADISAAAAIALSKIATLIGNPGGLISFESTAAVTHSLTTIANQKVIVWATASVFQPGAATATMQLQYNSVSKNQITLDPSSNVTNDTWPFALMYTEIPGAGTQNVTIVASAGTLQDANIIVCKLQVA